MGIGTWLKGLFGSSKVVEKGMEIADEAFHTDEEKAVQDGKDTNDAGMRESGPSGGTWFNAMVDAFNRLPRPAFALWAFGELIGWWRVKTDDISAEKMQLIIIIMTFYFGARVLLKDLPSVIKMLRSK